MKTWRNLKQILKLYSLSYFLLSQSNWKFVKSIFSKDIDNDRHNLFREGSERALIKKIIKIKTEMKIFTYPIPENIRRCDLEYGGFTPLNTKTAKQNFHMELELPHYFQNHSTLSTKNPEEADFFIIRHEWLCIRIGNEDTHVIHPDEAQKMLQNQNSRLLRNDYAGSVVGEEHLLPIMKNVIYNYPFFNRSFGHNHAFVFLMDNGPWCGGGHIQPFSSSVSQVLHWLTNVTIIGNNGYHGTNDMYQHYEEEIRNADNKPRVGHCFREGLDITIPQAHRWSVDNMPPFPSVAQSRPANIYFRGSSKSGLDCSPEVRQDLLRLLSGVDKQVSSKVYWNGGTTENSYFSLCPAGLACWSVRLYDAIFHASIPVILADPIIEPFERFIDWRKFTIKYITDNQNHPRNDTLLSEYPYTFPVLKKSELSFPTIYEDLHQIAEALRKSMDGDLGYYYTRKLIALKAIAPWLSFYSSDEHRNSYSLVLAELWCKLPKGKSDSACQRSSTLIADKAYL